LCGSDFFPRTIPLAMAIAAVILLEASEILELRHFGA
jgi:hypothetical protein